MRGFKHPVAIILIIVAVVVVVGLICDSIEDSSRQKTKQLECQVKLEQIKQFGEQATNQWNQVINKK